MAVFNKNSLTQVSGFNNQIIAGELVYNQQTYWNLAFTNAGDGSPINLTGATIDAQIIRRQISNLTDTRNGLTFDIDDYIPEPAPVDLTITNFVPTNGSFTLKIDEAAWSIIASDPELNIAINDCVAFSGRIKISMPEGGTSPMETPAEDNIIFLLFLVRSDGVVN